MVPGVEVQQRLVQPLHPVQSLLFGVGGKPALGSGVLQGAANQLEGERSSTRVSLHGPDAAAVGAGQREAALGLLGLSVVGVVPVEHGAALQGEVAAMPNPETTDQLKHRQEAVVLDVRVTLAGQAQVDVSLQRREEGHLIQGEPAESQRVQGDLVGSDQEEVTGATSVESRGSTGCQTVVGSLKAEDAPVRREQQKQL